MGLIVVNITKEGNNKIKFSVEDANCKMSKEKMDKIFSTSFLQDDKGKDSKSGFGITIYLTKILVEELLKGEIGCSTTDQNVGFNLWFTAYADKVKTENQSTATRIIMTQDMSTKHVLIIDDSDLSRKIVLKYYYIYIIRAIKSCNSTGNEAKDGKTALQMVIDNHYDAIITDLNMPEITGFDLARILRKNLNYQGPIITLTGEDPKDIIEKCKKVGIDEIITKPVKPAELTHTVMELIQRYKSKKYVINRDVDISKLL